MCGDLRIHELEKLLLLGGKGKYPARLCATQKKRSETKFCVVSLYKNVLFSEIPFTVELLEYLYAVSVSWVQERNVQC